MLRAFEVALADTNEMRRSQALEALAPRLEGEALARAFEAALAFTDEMRRWRLLAIFAPRLKDASLRRAFEACLAIEHEVVCTQSLAVLVPQLKGESLTWALQSTLGVAYDRPLVWGWLILLVGARLTDEQLCAALQQAVLQIQLSHDETAPIGNLLEAALAIRDDTARAFALTALTPELDEVTPAWWQNATKNYLTRLDWKWLSHLVGPRKANDDYLAALRQMSTLAEPTRLPLLIALGARLPVVSGPLEDVLNSSLGAALTSPNESARALLLAVLAPKLSDTQCTQVLSAAFTMKDENACAWALAALAPRLDGPSLAQAFVSVRVMKDESACAWVLAALAPRLDDTMRASTLERLLAMENESACAYGLIALMPKLNGFQRTQALEAAETMTGDGERIWVLAALTSHMYGLQSEELGALVLNLGNVKGVVPEISSTADAARAVSNLSELMPIAEKQPEALAYLRHSIVDLLAQLQTRPRQDILTALGASRVFTVPAISDSWQPQVAASILQVCGDWRWL